MKNDYKTLEQIDFNIIVFIIGKANTCFVFDIDGKNLMLPCSLDDIQKNIDFPGVLKINQFTLINSKFYIGKKPGRLISLKGGSIHKVSRNSWKYFKDMPAKF